jgi:hypothetical protein
MFNNFSESPSNASQVEPASISESPAATEAQSSPGSVGNVNGGAATPGDSPVSSINDGYLTIGVVTADQQAAYDRYPEALHFHPGISPPILGFDPRVIQDDFDPFDLDLSHLIDFDA